MGYVASDDQRMLEAFVAGVGLPTQTTASYEDNYSWTEEIGVDPDPDSDSKFFFDGEKFNFFPLEIEHADAINYLHNENISEDS